MKYIKRNIESALAKYLKIFPVVGLTGPRQSGKSTMLKKALDKKFKYVSFDDINAVNFFHNDPKGFMKKYSEYVVFDEIQYVPELFRYIKIAVDNNRDQRGRFILTGSSQFSFMKNVTESLAGRIGLLSLLPFEYKEIPDIYKERSLYLGTYPELSVLKYRDLEFWFTSYINTYLEKDVRAISNIGDIRDFTTFIKLLASRTSQILSLSVISREIGVSVNTVKRWISILEASYIIFLLPPFYNNFGKRLVKSPKIYFHDTGLVSFLIGIDNKKTFDRTPFAGAIFENYIISNVIKKVYNKGLKPEIYFLRTSNGNEIDLILNNKGKLSFIEIKRSSTFKINMISEIKSIVTPDSDGKLIYMGDPVSYNDQIKIENYKDFLSE